MQEKVIHLSSGGEITSQENMLLYLDHLRATEGLLPAVCHRNPKRTKWFVLFVPPSTLGTRQVVPSRAWIFVACRTVRDQKLPKCIHGNINCPHRQWNKSLEEEVRLMNSAGIIIWDLGHEMLVTLYPWIISRRSFIINLWHFETYLRY